MNMVEKVARALYGRSNSYFGAEPWDRLTGSGKASFLEDAAVAIAAMREPSEAQRAAGEKANTLTGNNNLGLRYTQYLPSWHAMIDAALAEGKAP